MDASNRSRSLSTDPSNNHSQSASSPSPHTITDKHNPSSFGLDQPIDFSQTNFNNSNHHLDPSSQQNLFAGSFDLSATSQSYSPQPDLSQTSLFTGHDLGQDTSLGGNFTSDNSLFSDFNAINNNGGFEQNLFPDNPSPSFGQGGAVDPRLLDPSRQSSDPNLLMAAMTSSSSHIPTPPHLLSPSMQRQTSGSPRGSPGLFQAPFPTPPPQDHSRGGSLDPSSAAYPQMQNWSGNETFRSHRRTHSDAHSDVSSSAHPSPFLTTQDSFEHTLGSHSPHMGAVADPSLFQDVMSFGQISINDAAQQQSYTPSHSPFTSPALLPQQQHLPVMNNVDNFGLQQNYGGQFQNNFAGGQNMGAYPVSNAELFPTLNQGIPVTTAGQADIMSPPEFKIDLAPPSRQPSFEPPKPDGNEEGLTPPDRSRSRHRMRALSDPFSSASSRGSTPSRDVSNRLSPVPAGVGSRSPSPSAAGKARRSSTSNVPNRDYILDLADPNRPASTATSEGGSASKRTQKHPATFQCTLCPKRFTRAYNLRSHLRTHTDERPFVCSVCGKAFARQHDRKRHEGLHSGEKKFVCRGNLKAGNHWGCGRRFARADALGRHFRSEAGRVCIKPLLEEEAHEKFGVAGQDAQGGGMGMMMGSSGMQPLQAQGQFDAFGAPQQYDQSMQMAAYRLPAALLAQYPTLGGIWDTLPLNAPDELDGHSGRSSFDASSAGEYDEGEDLGGQGGYSWHSDVGP